MKNLLSLPKPSAAAYAIIASFWAIVGLIALFLIAYLGDETDISTILTAIMYYWHEVLSIGIFVGLVIGSIHYLVARAYGRKDKQSLKRREISAVVLAASLLCAFPIYYIVDLNRTIHIENACFQREVYEELLSLKIRSDTRQAVRLMEEACEKYYQIDRENIAAESAWLIHRRPPSGFGYYYGMIYHGWYTLSMNLPMGVHDYLNDIPYQRSTSGEWQSLGLEMAASRTPIIRILGYSLLKDHERFTEEVYKQYDSGDQTYRALKDVACFEYDPDLKRALQHILSFTPIPMSELLEYGNYQFYSETDRDIRAYDLAIEILKSGQTLDDPDAIRPIIERYLKTSNTGRSYNPERQAAQSHAHKQLMTQLGLPIQ